MSVATKLEKASESVREDNQIQVQQSLCRIADCGGGDCQFPKPASLMPRQFLSVVGSLQSISVRLDAFISPLKTTSRRSIPKDGITETNSGGDHKIYQVNQATLTNKLTHIEELSKKVKSLNIQVSNDKSLGAVLASWHHRWRVDFAGHGATFMDFHAIVGCRTIPLLNVRN